MVPGQNNHLSYRPTSAPPPTIDPQSEPHCQTPSVITSTTPYISGYRTVKVVGTVHGSATSTYKDAKSFLKLAGSGVESKSLTHMLYNARDQATERMILDCISRGGNAIVGMGFNESEIFGFAQVTVYGTAVLVEKDQPIPNLENPFQGS